MNKLFENLLTAPTNPCPVRNMLNELDEETSQALNRLLTDPKFSTRKIHQALQVSGIKVGRDTLTYHRNKTCRCEGQS